MRRRDLLRGLWKRLDEHRAELPGETSDDRKRELSKQLDAGGAVRLPRYQHGEAEPTEQPPDAE